MIIFPTQSFFNDDFFSVAVPTQCAWSDSSPMKQHLSKQRAMRNNVNHNEPNNKLHIVNSRLNYGMNEFEDHYNVTIDVPGVKLSDIELDVVENNKLQFQAKRTMNEHTVKKYEQTFVFDNRKVDLVNVRAELENGLLTLIISKKKPEEPVLIVVTSSSEIPENGNKHLHDSVLLTLDLPGVKLDDLYVKVHEQAIHVDAKRYRGNPSFAIRKVVKVDDTIHDMKQVKANFSEGVLTVIAPRIETLDDESSSSKINRKTILISSTATKK